MILNIPMITANNKPKAECIRNKEGIVVLWIKKEKKSEIKKILDLHPGWYKSNSYSY